jgi:ParB family chromosome partitioning protein
MNALAKMITPNTAAISVALSTGRDVSMTLDRLYIADDNMTSRRDPDWVRSLAAMIEAQGLMHRLSITVDANGLGAVHAGGNRLLALQWLQSQGKLAADEPVECKAYEDAERAIALSLRKPRAHPAPPGR